ncbi:unnamed protein product, partial [Symbiodinium necroappetens]
LASDIGGIDGGSFDVLRSPRCAELGVAGPIGVEAADDPNAASRRAGSLQGDVPEIVAARTPTLAYARAGSSPLGPGLDPLAAVTHRNDEACWREILMLPQSVLDPLRRGGKQHTKAAATQPPPASSAPGPRHGFEGTACAALLCTGQAPDYLETTATIQPSTLCLLVPAAHQLPPTPELVPDVVAKALRSFNGQRGLRLSPFGEVFQRLAGKMFDVAVHAVRAWMDRHTGGRKILLKLYFENAFNCISGRCYCPNVWKTMPWVGPQVQILQPYMELLQELCVVARGFRAIAVLHGRAELAARLRPAQCSPLPPVCSRLHAYSVERLLAGDIPAIVRPLRRSPFGETSGQTSSGTPSSAEEPLDLAGRFFTQLAASLRVRSPNEVGRMWKGYLECALDGHNPWKELGNTLQLGPLGIARTAVVGSARASVRVTKRALGFESCLDSEAMDQQFCRQAEELEALRHAAVGCAREQARAVHLETLSDPEAFLRYLAHDPVRALRATPAIMKVYRDSAGPAQRVLLFAKLMGLSAMAGGLLCGDPRVCKAFEGPWRAGGACGNAWHSFRSCCEQLDEGTLARSDDCEEAALQKRPRDAHAGDRALALLTLMRLHLARVQLLVTAGSPDTGKTTFFREVFGLSYLKAGLSEEGRTDEVLCALHPDSDLRFRPVYLVDMPGFGDGTQLHRASRKPTGMKGKVHDLATTLQSQNEALGIEKGHVHSIKAGNSNSTSGMQSQLNDVKRYFGADIQRMMQEFEVSQKLQEAENVRLQQQVTALKGEKTSVHQ